MSYEVVITREDGAWLADVPSLPGAHTFARSLPSLYESVREVIVLMDDLADDARPDVTYRLDVDDALVATAADLGKERAEMAAHEADFQARTGKTILRLTEAGYSVRDVAALIGVSPGRISQMFPTRTAAIAAGRASSVRSATSGKKVASRSARGKTVAAKSPNRDESRPQPVK